MRAWLDAEGNLWLSGLGDLWADTLSRLIEWSSSTDARVQRRLYPATFEDAEEEAQWRRLAGTELEHLIRSREDLVREDLASLRTGDEPGFSLRISNNHRSAWLSSLNAARLALFELGELSQADMDREAVEASGPEKRLTLVRIHGLAFVQELLMRSDEVEGPCDLLDELDELDEDEA